MANIVLGLQGGMASGSEPSFDGQPTQPGVHLRWSFLAALGFPPGGFWLCRRAAREGEERIPPPPLEGCQAGGDGVQTPADPTRPGLPAPGNPWQASWKEPCATVTLAGCAAPGCDEVVIETFSRDADGALQLSGRRAVQVEQGCFRIRIQACEISCVRVAGVDRMDECCGAVEPPKDCGCGGGPAGGGEGGPPCQGQPGWGPPNDQGWQCWGVPFTLPVTLAQWPARYFGAPDPATTPASLVAQKDLEEAERRLGPLRLAAGTTLARQRQDLAGLRKELVRLVQGFPSTLLGEVPIHPGPGAHAPRLNLTLMQQLLLLALDPYFARVLGLYFVDDQAAPGVAYDYSIAGFWGATPCQALAAVPGLAPAAPLARGAATFGGITVRSLGGRTSLWRWTRFDADGNPLPRLDPSAPPGIQAAVAASLAGLAGSQLPAALLVATVQGPGWPFPSPPSQLAITLPVTAPRVDVQVAGRGTVVGLSRGTPIASASFNTAQLQGVTVNAPSPGQLLDQIEVLGTGGAPGLVVCVGALSVHPLAPDAIGTRYAITPPPAAIPSLAAPGQPHSTYRHRQADIDPASLGLVLHSLIDVEWPALPVTPAQHTGDPVSDPLALPPPTRPIGFVAERRDLGDGGSPQRLPGWIATRSVPRPLASQVPTANLYRLADSQLPDPKAGWSHRVAAFDLFGVLGAWSAWSAPRSVETLAAAPTALRIRQFDNSPAGGGAAAADGSAWTGGTLDLLVSWSGAAFLMYPDIATARITVQAIDAGGTVTGDLATSDLAVPRPAVRALLVSSITATPSADPNAFQVDLQTTPPLQALGPADPAQILMLTLADGSSERYPVRPFNPLAPAPGPALARIQAGPASPLVSSTSAFLGQAAFLLPGFAARVLLPVPLNVPVGQQTARARVQVTGSSRSPFLAGEQILDPNGVNPPRPEPESVALTFTGPQRLLPPAPPTPAHAVDHVYYDPADATGRAGKTLPFTTPAGPGILGYVLQRAPVRSLALADCKRRLALGNLVDPEPVVVDGGTPRADLAAWIAALGDWLNAFNLRNGTAWTPANALGDAEVQRGFIDHFHGGLLDDELRALGNLEGNAGGFARVNPTPAPPGPPLADAVDGTGFGRTLYRLAAVNAAGSSSSTTGSIGPYYTRGVTPPRPPVLYKLQPSEQANIVAWALDTDPEVAAYLVYRAGSPDALADLRYFGADWSHPVAAGALAAITYQPLAWPPLAFTQAPMPNRDGRLVGFVPDPRLCARDYPGSDMGEIALPPGPAPDQVAGVYRLGEYDSARPAESQAAFNYWTPPARGGIAQIVGDSPTQARLTGLRLGLGRGVPVVVVASWQGVTRALGLVPVRRAGFVDGMTPGGAPIDPNAIATAPAPDPALNAYAIVAVDIHGNRSLPSKVFAAQTPALA